MEEFDLVDKGGFQQCREEEVNEQTKENVDIEAKEISVCVTLKEERQPWKMLVLRAETQFLMEL